MEKYGKKVYTIAADYNFGQISAEWTRKLVTDNGGEIVGEELIPLGVSQFGQTIQNIQKAKPDWLMSLLVGNSQSSFYEQAPAAGLKIPMGSSITIGLGFEHKRFKPPAMENMHVAMNWFEELERPEGQGVRGALARQVPRRDLHQRHGPERLCRGLPLQAAGRDGRLDRARRRSASRSRPARPASTRPKARSASIPSRSMSPTACGRSRSTPTHKVTVERSWDRIEPYWLGEIGCDLTKNDPKEQYTPSTCPRSERRRSGGPPSGSPCRPRS